MPPFDSHFAAAWKFPGGSEVHSLVPVQAVKTCRSNHDREFFLQSLDALERTQQQISSMSIHNSSFQWNNITGETVTITFEGEKRVVPAGVTVAAALLGHDENHFCKSAADREDRGPYCLMGVCFECLVEINGIRNRQACLEPIVDGMNVKRQISLVE